MNYFSSTLALAFMMNLLVLTSVGAQDLNADIVGIINTFKNAENIQFKMDVQLFGHGKSKEPEYKTSADYFRSGKRMKMTVEELVKIFSDDFAMVIKNEEKEIALVPIGESNLFKEESMEISENEILAAIEDLQNGIDRYDFVRTEEGLKKYTIFPKFGEFDKIELVLDEHPFLKKVTYHYNQIQFPNNKYCVLDYHSFDNQKIISDAVFAKEKYVQIDAGKYKLTKAFENYELSVYEN